MAYQCDRCSNWMANNQKHSCIYDEHAQLQERVKQLEAEVREARNEAYEDAAKIVEEHSRTNVENPAIDMMERYRRSGIRSSGEHIAAVIRARAKEMK